MEMFEHRRANPDDHELIGASGTPVLRFHGTLAYVDARLVEARELHLADEQTIRNLEAACARYREALEKTEWHSGYCQVCGAWKDEGHRLGCPIHAALASNAGIAVQLVLETATALKNAITIFDSEQRRMDDFIAVVRNDYLKLKTAVAMLEGKGE